MSNRYKNLSCKQSLNDSVNSGLVAILLSTYNGELFLSEQLDSLESQTYKNWTVIASDDGSTDNTQEILKKYQKKWSEGRLSILNGPKKGFSQNFLFLACNTKIKANYYAFCDQDDVWLPTKLEMAISTIEKYRSPKHPFLYCGRTLNVNQELQPCGMSPLFSSPKNFQNAIIQNIAGGNTMVFDTNTKSLLEKVGVVDVFLHDWWLYILVAGSGGNIFYDSNPQIFYRQHFGSTLGGDYKLLSKIKRILMIINGSYKNWNSLNIIAANNAISFFSNENKQILKNFESLRGGDFFQRIGLIKHFVMPRRTWRGNLSFLIAILLRKF